MNTKVDFTLHYAWPDASPLIEALVCHAKARLEIIAVDAEYSTAGVIKCPVTQ